MSLVLLFALWEEGTVEAAAFDAEPDFFDAPNSMHKSTKVVCFDEGAMDDFAPGFFYRKYYLPGEPWLSVGGAVGTHNST